MCHEAHRCPGWASSCASRPATSAAGVGASTTSPSSPSWSTPAPARPAPQWTCSPNRSSTTSAADRAVLEGDDEAAALAGLADQVYTPLVAHMVTGSAGSCPAPWTAHRRVPALRPRRRPYHRPTWTSSSASTRDRAVVRGRRTKDGPLPCPGGPQPRGGSRSSPRAGQGEPARSWRSTCPTGATCPTCRRRHRRGGRHGGRRGHPSEEMPPLGEPRRLGGHAGRCQDLVVRGRPSTTPTLAYRWSRTRNSPPTRRLPGLPR